MFGSANKWPKGHFKYYVPLQIKKIQIEIKAFNNRGSIYSVFGDHSSVFVPPSKLWMDRSIVLTSYADDHLSCKR